MKIPIFAFILLAYLGANYYIFHRVWDVLTTNIWSKVALICFAVLVVLAFFIVFAVGESLPIGVTSFLYIIGSSWLFITLYLFLFFIFQDLILLANKGLNFIPSHMVYKFSKENATGLLFTFGFITLLMTSGYLKYTWKQRVEIPIELTKYHNDSIPTQTIRAVAISDLHLGYTIGKGELAKWVDLINSENPDVVLIAGDIVDSKLRPLIEENYAEVMRKIKAPMGVYACLGNHEYLADSDYRKSEAFYKDANVQLLRDSSTLVDSLFYVVGRDDKTNDKRKEINELLVGLDRSIPIIMLDHQPFHLQKVEENKIDIQISGHTHKGQVWPLSIVTGLLYEKDHGYLKKGDSHIYVSSGIGIWGGKFRIGTQSEYVVMDIKI